jgi:hypothetical protein
MSRKVLTYTLRQLRERDDLTIRSLMRLLSPRFDHDWQYVPDGAALWFVGDTALRGLAGFDGIGLSAQVPAGVPSIIIGISPAGQSHYLKLPIRADLLEEAVRSLTPLVERAAKEVATGAQASTNSAADDPSTSTVYRLTRWPTSTLLSSPWRNRAASVMLKAAVSESHLAERLSVPHADVTAFLIDLRGAGCLAETAPPAAATRVPTPDVPTAPSRAKSERQGLFARIRSSLGL